MKHSKKPKPFTPKGPVQSEEQIKLLARDQVWTLMERFMRNHCIPFGTATFAFRLRTWADTIEKVAAQIKATASDKKFISFTNTNPKEDEPTQLELPFNEETTETGDPDVLPAVPT